MWYFLRRPLKTGRSLEGEHHSVDLTLPCEPEASREGVSDGLEVVAGRPRGLGDNIASLKAASRSYIVETQGHAHGGILLLQRLNSFHCHADGIFGTGDCQWSCVVR